MKSRLNLVSVIYWMEACMLVSPSVAFVNTKAEKPKGLKTVESFRENGYLQLPANTSSFDSSSKAVISSTVTPSLRLSNLSQVCAEDDFNHRKESILNYFLRMRSCDVLENTQSRMKKICHVAKFAHNEYYNVAYLAACDSDLFRKICEVGPEIIDPWAYDNRPSRNPSIKLSESQSDNDLVVRACVSVSEFLRELKKIIIAEMMNSTDTENMEPHLVYTFSEMVKASGKMVEVDYSEWYVATFPFCRNFAYGSTKSNHSIDKISVYECMPKECRGFIAFSVVLDAVLAVSIILSNCLVLGVAARTKIMRNIPGYFKISLALADLTVGIFVLPCCIFVTYSLYLDTMPYRGPGHRMGISDYMAESVASFIGFFVVLSFAVSVYTMAIASVDRYLAITKPFQYRQGHYLTKRRSTLAFALIWLLAFLISIFPVFSGERFGVAAYNIVLSVGVNSSIVYAVTLFIPLLAVWTLNGAMLKQVCADREKRSSIRASSVIANSPQKTLKSRLPSDNDSRVAFGGQKINGNKDITVTTSLETTKEPEKSLENSSSNVNGESTVARNATAPAVSYQKKEKAGSTPANDGVIERMKKRKRSRLDSVFQRKSSRKSSVSNSVAVERRLARTLAIMIGAFTSALLPCIITLIAYAVTASDTSPKTANQLASAIYVASRVLLSNSFWNCIIYSIRNQHFRRAMWAIFLCKKEKIDKKLRESITMSHWKRRSQIQSSCSSSSNSKRSLSKSNSTNSSSDTSYRKDHRRSTVMWSFASNSPSDSRKGSSDALSNTKDIVSRTVSCPRDYPKPGILKKTVGRSESAPHTNQNSLPTPEGVDTLNAI